LGSNEPSSSRGANRIAKLGGQFNLQDQSDNALLATGIQKPSLVKIGARLPKKSAVSFDVASWM
jgi:hypothetical protein